ncbi:hypothetical protein EDD80_11021 [Anseongella ginsenosidimutans]|uniref:GAF domain-containing protein n=1 Tax=Anseongella ginsenosidimutans TaxID=496056 RepID=A0A4R3KNL6_9SPHI|nr:GAF domain-containing protein [Anseongella ginsenosidimutans]QEC52428.1 GAF domain-containing protein [Anseongella ginsenosidimutans]TCS85823.1 hypothetical protein EDD80_11021 [Anseongella ginsenosidimutans]
MDVLSTPFPGQVLPQLNWELSFRPYLDFIEAQISRSRSTTHKTYLEAIAAILRQNPVLLEPIEDFSILENFSELAELIKLNHVQRDIRGEEPMFAIGTPFPMQLFSYSENFRALMLDEQNMCKSCLSCEFVDSDHLRKLYWMVLEKCYGLDLDQRLLPDTFLRLKDEGRMRRKHYRFSVNHHFVNLRHSSGLPPLQQEWIDFALGLIRHAGDLKIPLPLEDFIAEGFMVFTIRDETEEMSLQELQRTIADMHTVPEETTFTNIKQATLSLLGKDEVELGILPFIRINKQYRYHAAYNRSSVIFELLSRELPEEKLSDIFHKLLNRYLERKEGGWLIYNDLEESAEENEVEQLMNRYGFQSLGIFPVWHREKLLGILEVASKKQQVIDTKLTRKIEQALPLYREFLTYQTGRLAERMNSYIMRRYTAIQPAVQWKFNEAAWKAFAENIVGAKDGQAAPENIRFENLHPFYGAVDVRNSSVERLNAVRQDLWLQLEYLEVLLDIAESTADVKEMQQKVQRWQQLINLNITLEEEVDLRDFLEESVSFVSTLKQGGLLPLDEARDFEQKMKDESSEFHSASWGFEQSLKQVNESLKASLEQAEATLQERIPHYFEKFKTDGWEFNLYAGESISPWRSFSEEDADAVCRWQLDTMIAMANASHAVRPKLLYPLNTTQLVFVHSNLVDISYRSDERRFDVEGAYSIRYEVIKKRIDKVRLLGSEERLTQPGTIAIVYVHSRNAVYYRKQLRTLISEGKLLPGIEMLDLEELQGISGLKALRVRINYRKL